MLYYKYVIAVLGVGIWDTNFGVYHSWTPLPDSKQSQGQVYSDILVLQTSHLKVFLFLLKSFAYSMLFIAV